LKVLAAAQPLSLQAHPSREQAEAGHRREQQAGLAGDAPDRVYADDWPKPEMLVALGEVEAVCGFREPGQTYALFAQLEVPDALALVEPLAEGGATELEAVFARLLRLTEDDHGTIAQVVAAAAEAEPQDADLAEFARTALHLDQYYPGDPGILAALLMNRVRLRTGEALFLPAGNLHAYLHGMGVEIMANSDNVLRGGLTGKYVAAEELLAIVDFTPGRPEPVEQVAERPGLVRYRTPEPEFALWRAEPGAERLALPAADVGRVLLAVEGSVVLSGEGAEMTLRRGQAAFAKPGSGCRPAAAARCSSPRRGSSARTGSRTSPAGRPAGRSRRPRGRCGCRR
jgi:mannose-6-phosphate isomerase